jgi:hypothetical protein
VAADEAVAAAPEARSGLSFGWLDSSLVFDGETDADLVRTSIVASTDVFLREALTLQIAAGAVLGGELDVERGPERSIGPGWVLSSGVTWRLLDGVDGPAPWLLLSLGVSATGTRTVADPPAAAAPLRGDWLSLDARLGVTVGKTFGEIVSPYAAARVFGGPVLWSEGDDDRVGSDRYHVQLAAGGSLRLGPVDVFAEGAPLGERGVSAGVGIAY